MKSLTDRVDSLFCKWNSSKSPGCALGLIKDGRFVYKQGYGMANLEHDIPISPQTVFRIGSVSKQFTAMCIALLVEQGKIALDDDIRKYIPRMPQYERPMTISNLVYHTSGLRDYLDLMELAGKGDDDFYTVYEALEMLSNQEILNFLPGEEYLYCNSGYFLLGLIIEKVSGRSLREFAAEKIFKPLGMENTHFHDDSSEIVRNRASGYSLRNNGGYRINMASLNIVGDGSVFTTVGDLYLWDQNFYGNKLGRGDNELIRRMRTKGRLNGGKTLGYAYGLKVGNYKGLKFEGHGGSFAGYRAAVMRFPREKFSVICLANLSGINPGRLIRQVADLYFFDEFEEEEKTKQRSLDFIDLKLRDKIGIYWSPRTDRIVELSQERELPTVETYGRTFKLVPVSATKFKTQDVTLDVEVEFEKRGTDRPWLLHLIIGDEKPDDLRKIEVVPPDEKRLAEYTGNYYSNELQVAYELMREDGKLYIRYRNAPQDFLDPIIKDVFKVGNIAVRFHRDDKGEIVGLTVNKERSKGIKFVKSSVPNKLER